MKNENLEFLRTYKICFLGNEYRNYFEEININVIKAVFNQIVIS